MMTRLWTPDELTRLREIWGDEDRRRMPIADLLVLFPKRSYRSICSKAWAMGLGRPKLSPGEGNSIVLGLLARKKMTTKELMEATGYSIDVLRGILQALRDSGRVHIASRVSPPRGGWPLNVWAAAGSPDAPENLLDQLRPHAGNPFAQLFL
jgi:hypothetical protein